MSSEKGLKQQEEISWKYRNKGEMHKSFLETEKKLHSLTTGADGTS